jgi:hypothetical protein
VVRLYDVPDVDGGADGVVGDARATISDCPSSQISSLFLFFYFLFFYFLCHEICRKVIVSNAFAYGTEIWQVDSLWKYADRMFISHKSAEGFQRGRDA